MSTAKLLEWKNRGLTLSEISAETGIPESTIRYRYNSAKIDFVRVDRTANSKWNLSRLENWSDVDAQYVIGFLAADGYIETAGYAVCLWVQERDVEVLERVLKVFSREDYTLRTRKLPSHRHQQKGIYICSKRVVTFLEQNYGFTRRKGRELPFPVGLINPLPYLRGYFDGNGYIGQSCTFTVASKGFAAGLLDWVERVYGIIPNVQMCGINKDVYNIVFRKKHRRFIDDLFSYDGLARKTEGYKLYLPNQRDRSRG